MLKGPVKGGIASLGSVTNIQAPLPISHFEGGIVLPGVVALNATLEFRGLDYQTADLVALNMALETALRGDVVLTHPVGTISYVDGGGYVLAIVRYRTAQEAADVEDNEKNILEDVIVAYGAHLQHTDGGGDVAPGIPTLGGFGVLAEDSSDMATARQVLSRAGVAVHWLHCIDGSCIYRTHAPVPATALQQVRDDPQTELVTDVQAVELGTSARVWSEMTFTTQRNTSASVLRAIKSVASDVSIRRVTCAPPPTDGGECFVASFVSSSSTTDINNVTTGATQPVVYSSVQGCFIADIQGGPVAEQGHVILLFAGIAASELSCNIGVCCFTSSVHIDDAALNALVAADSVLAVSTLVPRTPAAGQKQAVSVLFAATTGTRAIRGQSKTLVLSHFSPEDGGYCILDLMRVPFVLYGLNILTSYPLPCCRC